VLAGAAAAVLLALDQTRLIRPLAALAVSAVIWGWALAQYPLLLPPRLTVHDAAAPAGAGVTELVVVAIIVVLVGPSFALLYSLAQRGTLSEPGAR
jgi:cytochrome d ubiquinol oxidase subunit II